ncbi:hypothetical protein [Methylobacterium flocculans]|uniref:hypothetical protein n=1 Tax=Methylobacterium flocculans TaxID=2984843 RepID=UPI0021F29168|nr:hypothetical protein [Methylobacterium sp. FF17]
MSDFEGYDRDPERVKAAFRRLTIVADLEDAQLVRHLGHWPHELNPPGVKPELAATVHPISYACWHLANELTRHLGTLIGQAEAQQACAEIVAEQRASPELREIHAHVATTTGATSMPAPSKSVH